MSDPHWRRLFARLSGRLGPSGIDLAAPMQVDWYNRNEPAALHLPTLAGPSSLAIVLGNSRAMWRPFLRGLQADPSLLDLLHPLDAWVERQLLAALEGLDPQPSSIHQVNGPDSRSYSMQRAAVATGLVGMTPTRLAMHRQLGLWFGLRAVLLFPLPGPERPVHSGPIACGGCSERPCVPALERALGRPAAGAEAPSMAIRDHWEPWLALRDSCPEGRQHRYGELQLGYHYSKQRRYLLEDLAGLASSDKEGTWLI